jgi:tetratricopeptide (TPR) repeat protein
MVGLACLAPGTTGAEEDPASLFRAGRYDEARVAFAERLSQVPDDPEALYYMGRLVREGAKARGYFERLLEVHPDHDLADEALYELAEGDYAGPQGLYLRARRRYERLLESHPESPLAPRARYRIGLIHLVLRHPDSAAVAFQVLLERSPSSEMAPFARLGSAESYAQMGRRAEALEAAQAVLQGGPSPVAERAQELIESLSGTEPGGQAVRGPGARKPETGRFWVQVGAFRNVKNIRTLAARLEKAGYRVREEAVPGGDLRLLLVGPYSDRAGADGARERILATVDLRGRVIERP